MPPGGTRWDREPWAMFISVFNNINTVQILGLKTVSHNCLDLEGSNIHNIYKKLKEPYESILDLNVEKCSISI